MTALFITLSIQSLAQDSSKFVLESKVMRGFVKKVFQAKGYKKLNDSSEAQIKNNEKEISNLNLIILRDSVQIAAAEDLLKEKDKTSAILTKQADDLKSVLEKESRFKNFWKRLSGILAIIGGSYIAYDQLNK